jgi:hypothetical protein
MIFGHGLGIGDIDGDGRQAIVQNGSSSSQLLWRPTANGSFKTPVRRGGGGKYA